MASFSDDARLGLLSTAFGTKSKLKILELLSKGPMPVSEIVRVTRIEQTSVSHSLRQLSKSGLVSYTQQGKMHMYQINGEVGVLFKAVIGEIRKYKIDKEKLG